MACRVEWCGVNGAGAYGDHTNSTLAPVLSGSHMLPVTHPEVLANLIHERVGAYCWGSWGPTLADA